MCIYGVYACKGGQEAGKGRPSKIMKKSNSENKKVYSYTLLGGGKIFWNSNAYGCILYGHMWLSVVVYGGI